MRLNDIRDEAYAIAKSKGWHPPDDPATAEDRIALMISELSEALEEYRRNVDPKLVYFADAKPDDVSLLDWCAAGHKPEGIGIEFADVIIRIGDFAGRHDLDFEDAALTPADGVWHKSFGSRFCEIARTLLMVSDYCDDDLIVGTRHFFCHAAQRVAAWADSLGIDLEECIRLKTAFNRTRPERHGGKKI